jgi:hypothetical protein
VAPQLEPDRAVKLAALSSAPVSPVPNERSAVVRRRPDAVTEPWPRNRVAMPTSGGRRGVSGRAAGRGRVRTSRRRRGPRSRPDDRRELGSGSRDGPQETPRFTHDLADRTRPDRRQLAPEVLHDRREEAHDVVRGPGELGPQVLALGGDPGRQVSRWHWRAMSQPIATSAAVPNANSSAPSSAATSRSRPV